MTRLLVIMGSGETTPTMIKTHRQIFDSMPDGAGALLLDTPYGFQLNADDISAKAASYFAQSVGRRVDVLNWRTPPEPGLARERALTTVRSAGWIFAGPGSPTYALRQWQDTELPQLLASTDVLIFASAAALTLGSHAIPVYEIYKAGAAPHWQPGLNLFEQLTGVPAVIIPHYDNAEGGHHDTRFCYLGEPRLAAMERDLPGDAVIVGVDEHTALICDIEAGTATVVGNGGLTVRRNGQSVRHESGTVLPLHLNPSGGSAYTSSLALDFDPPVGAVLADRAAAGLGVPSDGSAASFAPAHGAAASLAHGAAASPSAPPSLRAAADLADQSFTNAMASGDVDGCVAAVLDLEQAILDWQADTLTSDDGDHARGLLRGMIVRLGELAVNGVRDRSAELAPFVEALLALRQRAREQRDFAASDQVRDALANAGVEVRDTPDGPAWSLRD